MSALQKMLDQQSQQPKDSERNMMDEKPVDCLDIIYLEDGVSVKRSEMSLEHIDWSWVNHNVPNKRHSLWGNIPEDANIVCIQYKNSDGADDNVQIGITGSCKKKVNRREPDELWEDGLIREIKEEIGMELHSIPTFYKTIREVGEHRVQYSMHWLGINGDELSPLEKEMERDERNDNKKIKIGAIVWTQADPENFINMLEISAENG